MRTVPFLSLPALAVALLVSACGSSEMTRDTTLLRDVASEVFSRPDPVPDRTPPVALTRAQVQASPLPLLVAEMERIRSNAVLAQIGANRGVRTFSTADGVTLALDSGMLVATRGLAGDLMSAAAPPAARIAAGSGGHARSLWFLGDLDRSDRQDFACTLQSAGSETIAIVGRSHATRVVDEHCSGESASFTNRFWLDSGGRIRQSRQWAGETVGFLKLSDPSG